ncbi:transposase family protein [Streptomyces noursei]|uniref:transposase family protein n=1 Tax=Streptomyces noursei TaxID=1971 RepID=UPI002154FCD6|nr:transposase family protein [Streptomyces noursei]
MPACTTSLHPALERLHRAGCSSSGAGLREWLEVIPDPRGSHGVRHVLVVVLVIAACAVLAGSRSLAAIGEWAADLPQHVLEALDARWHPASGLRIAPSESTIRWTLQSVDGQALDQAVCGWLGEQTRQSAPREGCRRPSRWTARQHAAPAPPTAVKYI